MISARVGFLLLVFVVVGSALTVVYTKHESRKLFIELQDLKKEQDKMDIEWGRLQLEQSTWATYGRVEKIARKRLGMHIPSSDEVVIVRP